MRSHPGVAAKVFEVLGAERINIEMISTSPIKISCVISADRVSDAVNALHRAFELGADAVVPEDPIRPRPAADGRRLSAAILGDERATATESESWARPGWSGRRSSRCSPRGIPGGRAGVLRSARSAGRQIEWGGEALKVRELGEDTIGDLDLALFSAGGSVSAEWTPKLVAAGATVVDNSSYWRMKDDVPLVVAEVNPEASRATAASSRTRTARRCSWSRR